MNLEFVSSMHTNNIELDNDGAVHMIFGKRHVELGG
jgi:hypothetical protein